MTVTPFQKLAKAILWQAVKDITPARRAWLQSASCAETCKQAGVAHAELVKAMEYILEAPDMQRAILLQNLKKGIYRLSPQ